MELRSALPCPPATLLLICRLRLDGPGQGLPCSCWMAGVEGLFLRATESFWPSGSEPLGPVLPECMWAFKFSWVFGLKWLLVVPSAESPVSLRAPSCCLQLSDACLRVFSVCCSAGGCGEKTPGGVCDNLPELGSSVSYKMKMKFLGSCVWLWG